MLRQEYNSVYAWFARVCVSLAVLVCHGCSSQVESVGVAAHSRTVGQQVAFEAGVVLADREGYLCLRFEQLGLQAGDEVLAVNSSCECVEPRLVTYVAPGGGRAQAVLLETVPELQVVDAVDFEAQQFPAVSLGVVVVCELSDGRTHEFTVRFLHTVLVAEVTS